MGRRIVALNDRGRLIGEGHPNAKLSDADIDLIFALREEGLTLSAIAAKFEVCKSCVHKILHGHRRAHTPVEWVPAGTRGPGTQGSRPP